MKSGSPCLDKTCTSAGAFSCLLYMCMKAQLEGKWLTLSLVLNLEKRLQAATLSPAVFRANILASMFDTLKDQKHIFQAHDPSSTWEMSSTPGAQTAEPVLLQWPPGPPGRLALCPWCHCWCCGRSAPSPPESPPTRTQPQRWGKPVQRRAGYGGSWTEAPLEALSFTFSSILVSFWSSRRVSEPLVIGDALVQSEGVQLSPPASPISSSVAFKTFKTSVVMLQRDAAEYFCFTARTQEHVNDLNTFKKVKLNGKWF